MKYTLLFILSIFLFSCAQIQNPTGGQKDVRGPKITKEKPANKSTQLSSDDQIEITFDEFIKLNNLSKELIVSPPLDPIPTIRTKGKKLIIDISECNLQENTTYSIFLGDAVVDYNESNPIRNFSYVFSTGTTIDSLSLTGSVIDIETGFVAVNSSVMLYSNLSDTFELTSPSYLSKTDSFGRYTINNLPNKPFKLLVVQDDNGNKTPDTDEKIAFTTETVYPDTNASLPTLYLYTPNRVIKQSIKDTILTPISTKLVFTKEINNEQIQLVQNNKEEFKTYEITKDTLIIYHNTKNNNITIYNSDTIVFNTSRKLDTIPNLKYSYQITNLNKLIEKDTLQFKYPYPIQTLNINSFIYFHENQVKQGTITQLDPFTLGYNAPFQEGTAYKIIYDPKSISSMDTSAIDTIPILIRANNTLGTIICKIERDSVAITENYIIQLFNKKELIKQKAILSDEVNFKHLNEGFYTIRIIKDSNNDNKWTPGSRVQGIQPEKIIHYQNEIEVKQNWDLEVTISLKSN